MSLRLIMIAYAMLFMSCVTPQVKTETYQFPQRFSAIQLVRVTRETETKDFLATLDRDGDSVAVVLLDPILTQPLLRLELDHQDFRKQGGYALPLRDSEGRWLMQTLASMLTLNHSGMSKGTVSGSINSHVNYELSAFRGQPDCLYPLHIKWQLTSPEKVAVAIENREWSCQLIDR